MGSNKPISSNFDLIFLSLLVFSFTLTKNFVQARFSDTKEKWQRSINNDSLMKNFEIREESENVKKLSVVTKIRRYNIGINLKLFNY